MIRAHGSCDPSSYRSTSHTFTAVPKPCLIFHPNQTKSEQHGRLCSWLTIDAVNDAYYLSGKHPHCALQDEVWISGTFNELCDNRCPIRCKEEIFFVSYASQQMFSPHIKIADKQYCGLKWANITVRYQDPHRKLHIQEQKLWRGDTFAASFASSVSVWIGVSGLSFIEFGLMLFGLICGRSESNNTTDRHRPKERLLLLALVAYFAVICGIFVYPVWAFMTI